jgi:hypothetical protein
VVAVEAHQTKQRLLLEPGVLVVVEMEVELEMGLPEPLILAAVVVVVEITPYHKMAATAAPVS